MLSPVMKTVLYGFLREYPMLMTCTMASTLATFIVESVVIPRLLSSTFVHLENIDDLRNNLVKLVLSWISAQVGNGFSDYYFAKVDVELCDYLRKRIFHQLFLKYEQDHQDIPTAKLMDTIELLQTTVKSMLYRFLSVFPRFVIVIIIIINLCSIHMKLGLYIAVILFMFLFLMVMQSQRNTHVHFPSMDIKSDFLDYTSDVFINMERVSSIHGAMKREEEKCHSLTDKYKGTRWEISKSVLKDQFMNYGINIVIFSFILYQLFLAYRAHEISNEQVIAFVLSVSPLFINIYEIIFYMPEFARHFGVLSYYTDFMEELFSHTEHHGEHIEFKSSSITLDHVTFGYKDRAPVLTDVSLTIPSGSFLTLRGPSGIGKSTLFKLLFRTMPPTSGTILLDGHDISTLSGSCIRKNILYLNQHSTLFNDTVYRNMIYGEEERPELRATVEGLIRDHHWTSLFSDKDEFASLDAAVGPLGKHLSGGQRQLVHLIRCFLSTAPILLLDEPTSAIDGVNTNEIMSFLTTIHNKGKTILLISHEDTIFSNDVLNFQTMVITPR